MEVCPLQIAQQAMSLMLWPVCPAILLRQLTLTATALSIFTWACQERLSVSSQQQPCLSQRRLLRAAGRQPVQMTPELSAAPAAAMSLLPLSGSSQFRLTCYACLIQMMGMGSSPTQRATKREPGSCSSWQLPCLISAMLEHTS